MRSNSYLGLSPDGFHTVRTWDWGEAAADEALICVHGLSRNGRDFDALAADLAGRYHIACPDVIGRGESDWVAAQHYGYPQYCADMNVLIGRMRNDVSGNGRPLDWIGTSMGGLIGMMIAAFPGSPIRRLVLNDVGPLVSKPALEHIASYIDVFPEFDSVDDAARAIATNNSGFGPLSDDQWYFLAETSVKQLDNGKWTWRRDPGIGQVFKAGPIQDVALWEVWDAIRCPVLVIRGGDSPLLTTETAEEMTRRGPKAEVVTLPGIGHAPALLDEDQIAIVRDWLAA